MRINGDILSAIETVETERKEHVRVRDHWLSIPDHDNCEGCKTDEENFGSLDYHREMISGLDNVLVVLRAANELSGQKKRWWQRRDARST